MSFWDFLYIIINFICVAVLIYRIIPLVPYRNVPSVRAFFLLFAVLVIWLAILANQVTFCFSVSHLTFFHHLSESVFILIPVALVNLTDKYARTVKIIRPWMYIVYGIFSLIVLGLIWTNQSHHLYWNVEQVFINGNRLQLLAERTTIVKVFMIIQHLAITLIAFHFLNLIMQLDQYYSRWIRFSGITLGITTLISALRLIQTSDMRYNLLPAALTFCCASLALFITEHNIFDLVAASRVSYFEQLNDGAIVTSSKGTIININQTILTHLDSKQAETIRVGKNILEAFPEWTDAFHAVVNTTKDQKTILTINQEEHEYQFDIALHANVDAHGFISTILFKFQDVTFYRQLLEQVNELAIRDPLTGILNRRHFELLVQDHLNLARRYQRNGCLMMIDLDNFKEVNDYYGHQTGDKVLTQFAAEITTKMRTTDIFARYGGDEFLLYLPETDVDGAMIAINHMKEFLIGKNIEVNELLIPLKCSVGICDLRSLNQGTAYADLVSHADRAMYASKSQPVTAVGISEGETITFRSLLEIQGQ